MRVISGYLKGRSIMGYNTSGTRPTMDRVKESMFASVQDYIDNSVVLDLFCGSGSLGIEAISMGCRRCYFVDNGKEILSILNKNIKTLGIADKAFVIDKDYRKSLLYFRDKGIKFNLIIVDAPYQMKCMEEVISLVNSYDLLFDNGLLILEYSIDELSFEYGFLSLKKQKKYGDKYVNIYQKVID